MIINEISNKSKQTSSYRKEQFRYASVAWKEVTMTVFWLSYKKTRLFKAKNSLFPTTETWDINMNFKLMRSYKIFVLFYLANYSMFIFFNLKLKKYTQKSILWGVGEVPRWHFVEFKLFSIYLEKAAYIFSTF